jgi:hypothetical protein
LEDTAPKSFGRGSNGVDRAHDVIHQLVDVERTAVGKFSFGERPNAFIGIEVRGVSRKVLDVETRLLAEELVKRSTVVGGGVIQQDDDGTSEVPQQLAQKKAHFLLPDVVEVQEIVETQVLPLRTDRNSGNHGDFVSATLAMTLNRG